MAEMFKPLSRRAIVAAGGLGLTGLVGPRSVAHGDPAHPLDRGRVEDGKVTFDPISDPGTEAAQKPADPPLPMAEKVGFAIVGLGRLTMEEILPAFGESRRAKIAGLVSGSPEKLQYVGAQHGVGEHALYNYEDFERIAENPDIKAVYIVLPNALHYEFVLRAAKAGKHVLCEKPMAVSSSEALGMINACAAAKVRLMIAYRCQYEPANRRLAQMMREREFGPLKLVEAVNAQNEGDPAQWRLRKALAGGGALPDIGLYCLNTIRALTGEEPSEIEAQMWSTPNDRRFREVEESVTWLMRFPSGIHATCATHYGVHKAQTLLAHTPSAALLLENAFAYRGQRLRISSVQGGVETDRQLQIRTRNQFALELDHMAECVLSGRRPRTPGEEGLQDHILMEAIYEAAATRSVVRPRVPARIDAFRGPALDKS